MLTILHKIHTCQHSTESGCFKTSIIVSQAYLPKRNTHSGTSPRQFPQLLAIINAYVHFAGELQLDTQWCTNSGLIAFMHLIVANKRICKYV